MNNINFENEIFSLISEKIEGPYWDFKRSWHTALMLDLRTDFLLPCKLIA